MNNRNGNAGSDLDSRLDKVKENVKGMVDKGEAKVHAMKERVTDAKQQVVSKGSAYLDRASEMIKANPLKSVGIAFGVGYIGMRLFRR
jgi:ElaB/YqjD/DUF883 family membrane-anchored ribosome-binding protein